MKGDVIPSDAGSLAAIERDPYQAAMLTWLEGKAENTRRSYMAGLRDFLDYTGEHPSEAEPLDVAGWKEDLKGRGLADATVAQRLSAVSSYYTYLVKQGIQDRNPVDAVGRNDLEVNPYERAHKLPLQAFRRILDVIPTGTEIGARDRALLLFYVLCARRRSEVVGLRAQDLRIEAGKVTYRARLKGGKTKWKELPPPVWEAIRHYLDLAGRDPKGDDPIFTPTTDAGQYLRDYYGAPEPEGPEPLTGEAVAQALKRHAAAAGLDPDAVTVHSLRHLGAELFKEASGDLRETQYFLDHARLETTAIYMKQLTGEEHRHWQAMANALGV
jgi:integrase/recombinase XerD